MNNLTKELDKWSKKYDLSFQFWEGNNSFYVEKNDVELHSSGGFLTSEECIKECLLYIYKINRVSASKRIF